MKNRISNTNFQSSTRSKFGFTITELLIGSAIMIAVIVATVSLYMKSNEVTTDQQQFTVLQHDVRAAMYFISRDLKSVGAGLSQQFAGYFLEGSNNDSNQTPVQSDRITILGNSDPCKLIIFSYNPSGSASITLEPNEFALYPYEDASYPADPEGYINRIILILPNPNTNTINGELGRITNVNLNSDQITFQRISSNNAPLPNGLVPGGSGADYVGGSVHFIEYKTYWLDVNGNYPTLVAGQDGYLGQPGVLYVSQLDTSGNITHQAVCRNIEDLQLQYHGDLNNDQQPDDIDNNNLIDYLDFLNWGDMSGTYDWDDPQVLRGIRRVRIFILGRTENPYISVSGQVPSNLDRIYGRPQVADSTTPSGAEVDRHRRFLLESTANVRNLSLNIYNTGTI